VHVRLLALEHFFRHVAFSEKQVSLRRPAPRRTTRARRGRGDDTRKTRRTCDVFGVTCSPLPVALGRGVRGEGLEVLCPSPCWESCFPKLCGRQRRSRLRRGVK